MEEIRWKRWAGLLMTALWMVSCAVSHPGATGTGSTVPTYFTMDQMPDLNWTGFYLVRDGRLVVGPFQGKPACIHIRKGRGVCGTCFDMDKTIVVPDVHRFSGHIACDSASNSEIVIPIHRNGEVAAVLDIDSPAFDRFSEDDRRMLEGVAEVMEQLLEW